MITAEEIRNTLKSQGFSVQSKNRPECARGIEGTLMLDQDGFEFVDVTVWSIENYAYTFRKDSFENRSTIVLTRSVPTLLTMDELNDTIEKLKNIVEGH